MQTRAGSDTLRRRAKSDQWRPQAAWDTRTPDAVRPKFELGDATHALRYSNQGDSLIFYPVQVDGTSVVGQYYKKFPDISTALNAFFNRHPDLFLYASLAESAPFLGEMDRLPIWEGKYQELAKAVNEEERRRQTRGSKLVSRVA